jgi:hypothetical protein
MVERLLARTTNGYGRTPEELAQVLQDLRDVEPLLRGSAHLVVDTVRPVAETVELILSLINDKQLDQEGR